MNSRHLESFRGRIRRNGGIGADESGADNAADLADNTLDMMVGRELKGDDFMSVNEMRDELYQCRSPFSLFFEMK